MPVPISTRPADRLRRARHSLEGLAVGDAFGEQFFGRGAELRIIARQLPAEASWRYTDDTNMALSIVEVLRQHDEVDQNDLARSFARHYHPSRGYGAAMHQVLTNVALGLPWERQARGLFNGEGSCGNGAAMRVAPLGAYFADSPALAAEQARLSAEVTHTHPEGVAGAIAVAVAASIAARLRATEQPNPSIADFLDEILAHVPQGQVNRRLNYVRDVPASQSVAMVVANVGNGSGVIAQDTVPLSLWCAARHLDNFEEALWATISALGDRDTTCAIVGGIVASYTGTDAIPAAWLTAREQLPEWPFHG